MTAASAAPTAWPHTGLARPEGPFAAGIAFRPPSLSQAARLLAVNAPDLLGQPGFIALVHVGQFAGVVAVSEAHAQQLASQVTLRWDEPQAQAGRRDGPASPTGAAYRWHAPACDSTHVHAWFSDGLLHVQGPMGELADVQQALSALLELPAQQIRLHAVGQSRPDGKHLACEVALLAHHAGRPVRMLAPLCPAVDILTTIERTTEGAHQATTHALASGQRPAWPLQALQADTPHRSAMLQSVPGYTAQLLPPPRAAGMAVARHAPLVSDDVLALAQTFALESHVDELARQADQDPFEFRLQRLSDPRAQALLQDVRSRAAGLPSSPGRTSGRGLAYAATLDTRQTPPVQTWSAWVVEVEVDQDAGHIAIKRLVVGHDSDVVVPEMRPRPVITSELTRTAQQLVGLVGTPLTPSHPAAPTPEACTDIAVDLVSGLPATQEAGAMAWTGAAALPAAAAIANAVFDATGIRLTAPNFQGQLLAIRPPRKRRAWWGAGLAATATATAMGALSLWSPWRPAIAPVPRPAFPLYSAEAIERGRLVAAAGDCAVCHTTPGGEVNAGGLGLPTPFGTIYTTNITPDEKTGIGNWSYEAFQRAMREGIRRDGRHLYPAFPYTAFARMSEEDLQSLYAYLMSQPAVSATAPETRLAFPYGIRPGLAVWNGLFHDPRPYQPDPRQSTAWNRGAYLVEGAGHCSACHSPRNAMGAEQTGPAQHLGGGEAEGWDAPALTARSPSPLPWTQQDFYDYLRTGHSARHGTAGGPMAPVVHSLQALPDEDIYAMATYLSSLKGQRDDDSRGHSVPAPQLTAEAHLAAAKLAPAGARVFEGACASCHDPQGPTLFGAAPNLATNTNLHADSPRNLVRIILDGTHGGHAMQVGAMPGFAKVLSDRQITDLTAYMRAAFAPQRPAWNADTATLQRLRSSTH